MRRTLYLLRHAKSSWDDLALADHDRPLASRGRRASRIIAAHPQKQRITPSLVLRSSATRARETLERVSAGFDEDIEVVIEEGLYVAYAGDLLERLRAVRPRAPALGGGVPVTHRLKTSKTPARTIKEPPSQGGQGNRSQG
jgi:phosphohistidine phosphatase